MTALVFMQSTELDPADAITGDEIVEVIQNGKSVRTTAKDLGKKKTLPLAVQAGLNMNAANAQVTRIDNSTTVAKTIAITDLPAGEAMTLVFVITGAAGVLTWPAGITWDKSTQPKPGNIRTVVVVFWDGTALTGSQGATA